MDSDEEKRREDSAFQERVRSHSLSELEDMVAHVDRGEYPSRAQKLLEEIRLRQAGPAPGGPRQTLEAAAPAGMPRRLWASLIDLFIHLLILGALAIAGWSALQVVSSLGGDGQTAAVSVARRGPSPLQRFGAGLLAGDPTAWKNREQWLKVGLAVLCFLVFKAALTTPALGRTGRTPGMREVGIRFLRTTGEPAGVTRALLWFWGQYLLFVLTLGVSALWMIWDPGRQALHDKLADTCVVREPRTWEKAVEDRIYD